jgi:hypothetical protein
VLTAIEEGTIRSSSFFSAAIGMKSVPIWRSSPPSWKVVSEGFIAPASSREMSSTAPRIVSTDSSEDSILVAASPTSPRPAFSMSEAQYSRAALSGCRMSWPAAARKRVFPRLASSASICACASSSLTRVSSAVRLFTRCSRVSLTRFSARSDSTRAVMSA